MGLTWLQFTFCTAVAVVGVPNIALGDALGSCIFNLLILLILEFRYPAVGLRHAVIASLFYRPATRTFRAFGWTWLFLLVVYSINSHVLFLAGG